MNFPRYTFSKECEPELMEFFKAVAEQKPSTKPETCKVWEKILPVNKEYQEKINSLKATLVEDEVIEILESDDEEISNKCDVQQSTAQEFLPPDKMFVEEIQSNKFNTTTIGDLMEGIEELLQTEDVLSEDIIQRLGNESPPQLEDMFTSLAKRLTCGCCLKLWKSIAAASCMERSVVISCFIKCLFVHKVITEQGSHVRSLFEQVFEAHPEEVSAVLQAVLLWPNNYQSLSTLKSNLKGLPNNFKVILLSVFKTHCAKLEFEHLEIVQSLLTSHADAAIVWKLTELAWAVAKEFASDKTFGRLLLEMLNTFGPGVVVHEQEFHHIIANHKSIFKTQIAKAFQGLLESQRLLSQSFMV